jgi:hypothetical protein
MMRAWRPLLVARLTASENVPMPHGFDVYRVFISAPGDLEADREACHHVIAKVNEAAAMPEQILLAAIGLRDNGQIEGHRAIVSDNVRWSSYFIQIFQDDWGVRDLYRKLLFLAVECRDDAKMHMRDVVIFLKDAPHETDPQILNFRKELEDLSNMQVCRYKTTQDMKAQLEEILNGWTRDLTSLKAPRSTEKACAAG